MTQTIPNDVRLAGWAILGIAMFVIWDQSYWWLTREDYAFGFLTPFFVGYIVYDRWPRIRNHYAERNNAGHDGSGRLLNPERLSVGIAMALFAFALSIFLLGALYRAAEGPSPTASMPMAIGFTATVLSVAFIFANAGYKTTHPLARFRFAMIFLFPAAIWLMSAPVFGFLERAIATYLLDKVAALVFLSFDVLGFALVREGSVLILPKGEVGVEDACSGIRSLTACLFVGTFIAAVFLDRLSLKIGMVFAALILAFATNVFRSLFLTIWAYRHGPEAIDGAVHDITGYAIIGVTVLGLLVVLRVFHSCFGLRAPNETAQTALTGNHL